jgi:hypothetical protein
MNFVLILNDLYWGSLQGFRACDCFCNVAVIKCALREQCPQFDPGRKHAFDVLCTENEKNKIPQRTEHVLHQESFCTVVVITCASHAQVPQYEPGRKHTKYVAEPSILLSNFNSRTRSIVKW